MGRGFSVFCFVIRIVLSFHSGNGIVPDRIILHGGFSFFRIGVHDPERKIAPADGEFIPADFRICAGDRTAVGMIVVQFCQPFDQRRIVGDHFNAVVPLIEGDNGFPILFL